MGEYNFDVILHEDQKFSLTNLSRQAETIFLLSIAQLKRNLRLWH